MRKWTNLKREQLKNCKGQNENKTHLKQKLKRTIMKRRQLKRNKSEKVHLKKQSKHEKETIKTTTAKEQKLKMADIKK